MSAVLRILYRSLTVICVHRIELAQWFRVHVPHLMMWHGRIILVGTVSLLIDSDVRSALPSHPRSLNAVVLYHAKTWSQYTIYIHITTKL